LVVNSPYGICGPKGMDAAVVKKLHDAFKDALYDAATQAVMEKFSMPTLYQNGAAYAADYKELEGVERANLKRVGLLAKQG
jgi:tripartite-type tricarboxylate transporter receptor subunit TctC